MSTVATNSLPVSEARSPQDVMCDLWVRLNDIKEEVRSTSAFGLMKDRFSANALRRVQTIAVLDEVENPHLFGDPRAIYRDMLGCSHVACATPRDNGAWLFVSLTAATVKEVRGHRLLTPHPYVVCGVEVSLDGSRLKCSKDIVFGSKSGWKSVGEEKRTYFNSTGSCVDALILTSSFQAELNAALLASIAFQNAFTWSIEIGTENGRSVCVQTDAVGALDFLRTRDGYMVGNRRAPLLHWVRSHMRQSRTDVDALFEVRKHLRGRRECVWNGLKCVVSEPPDGGAA